ARGHRDRSVGEDRAIPNRRSTVSDRDVSNTDGLHHAGLLARPNRFDRNLRLLRSHERDARENEQRDKRKSFDRNHFGHSLVSRIWRALCNARERYGKEGMRISAFSTTDFTSLNKDR